MLKLNTTRWLPLVAAMAPALAGAAGLGKLSVMSAIGQPLRAEIELSATRDELATLTARMASADAFRRAGLEFSQTHAGIATRLEKRGERNVIVLTSDRPVADPFLGVLVEAVWASGRLQREYTFLLDPADAPRPAPVAPVAVPEARPEARVPEGRSARSPAPAVVASAGPGVATRTVKAGDTLRRIAAEVKPEGVALEQMLVALLRENPGAFDKGNINRLRTGSILKIPAREVVEAVAEPDAQRVVVAQTQDFNAYRQSLAGSVAGRRAPEAESGQATSGRIAPSVQDKSSKPATQTDELRVSKAPSSPPGAKGGADGATGKGDGALQNRVNQLQEDLIARDKAIAEQNARLRELERNLADLQKLIEAKNQTLAELQKQARTASTQGAGSAAPAVSPAPPVAAAPQPAPAPAVAEPAKPIVEPAPPPVAAKPPAPPVTTKSPSPPPPPPEPGFVEQLLESPMLTWGGAGIGVLLLGFLGYRQVQRRKGPDASPGATASPSVIAPTSAFGQGGGQRVDTAASSLQTDFSQSSLSAIDADEGVDPVAEADVYIAYGRDAQAEEILLEALKSEPTRHAIHLKLLEIYAARKNTKQFESLASELYSKTGGVGGDWETAAAMGRKLDPENPLYGGAGSTPQSAVAEPEQSITDKTIVAASPEALRDTWTMPGELSRVGEDQSKPSLTPEATLVAPMDLDLDFGLPGASPPAAGNAGEAAVSAPSEAHEATTADAHVLDFDLGSSPLPVEPSVDAIEMGTIKLDRPLVAESNSEAPMPLEATLDFELPGADSAAHVESMDVDLTESRPMGVLDEAIAVVDLEKTDIGNLIDFNLDLPESPDSVPSEGPKIDFSDIDLDLGIPDTPPASSSGPTEVSLPPRTVHIAIPDGEDDLSLMQTQTHGLPRLDGEGESAPETATDSEEVNTKIELARAYEEMGDKEGARELLQEVLGEGSPAQQDKAREMISRL